MNMRFAAPAASAATAIILLAACSDDSATRIAQADQVELAGNTGLGGQTLNITAEEDDGDVTGEFRVTEVVVTIQCADTDNDGVVILGGEVTTPDSDEPEAVGELLAMIIREGNPDSVALIANDNAAESCTDLLESIPKDGLTDDSNFTEVEAGEDIRTA